MRTEGGEREGQKGMERWGGGRGKEKMFTCLDVHTGQWRRKRFRLLFASRL